MVGDRSRVVRSHRSGDRFLGVVTRMLGLPSVRSSRSNGRPGKRAVPLICDAVRSVDIEARRIDVDSRAGGEA